MHPQTLVPDTLHHAIQEHSVTRLARRPAPSHLNSCSISKHLAPWGHSLSCPVWLLCLVGFLPLISIIDVMRYIMLGLLRARQACLCQEFGSGNDAKPCIQPHTASLFSIHPLVTKFHHAALWDLWRWPTWWNMHGRCCSGPRRGYPGSTNHAKTCLATLLPRIWKPSFGSTFSIFSHWFNISFSQNTQEAGPYIWRSPERDCIYFMQVATFITQNWYIYTIWSCAPCRIDIGTDEFHSYTEEGFFTIRCRNRLWGGVWSDMTTEQVSGRLTWVCRITDNTVAKWVCVSLYTPCTPTEELNGSQTESSEQYCEAFHHKDLKPAQQADLGPFMWSIEIHQLLCGHYHGDLVSLSSVITGDS